MGSLDARATLAKYGEVPLPPSIKRAPTKADQDRYQTVYATHDGSVAAPTAGLHFTTALLARIHEQRTLVTAIDLHVGPGTFKPVETDNLDEHTMQPEVYEISAGAASGINHNRGKVWAVGTTVTRAVESAVDPQGQVRAGAGETSLFIRPPYEFKVVNHLITNYHLPRSTLLMLVCAFGGYAPVMNAYREAVQAGYRFYSYGDAMAII
jgi:S-adenosylmethionine:tRNA ribosyltransferase-isomerase